jgi:hypothetical protein
MLILHAGVHDGFFSIWLEASADHKQAKAAPTAGRPQRSGPPDYPYGAPPALLREILSSLPYCGEAGKGPDATSGSLGANRTRRAGGIERFDRRAPVYESLTLSPFSIASMQLGPKETVDFLAATFGRE